MPWATYEDVRQMVADGLKKEAYGPTPNGLKDAWQRIIQRSLNRAITDLTNAIRGKNFTQGQIEAWDDAYQYSLDQAYFFAMVEGCRDLITGDTVIDPPKRFDRVGMMIAQKDPLTLSIGGAIVTGGGTSPGATIGGGTINTNTGGVDFGTTFGTPGGRRGGFNQYGDPITEPGW